MAASQDNYALSLPPSAKKENSLFRVTIVLLLLLGFSTFTDAQPDKKSEKTESLKRLPDLNLSRLLLATSTWLSRRIPMLHGLEKR